MSQVKMLEGLTVFISGAASGLGREFARSVVQAGGTVIANDIDAARLDAVQAELGERCIALAGDIGAAGGDLVAEGIERAGSLDAIINNAGWTGPAPIVDLDPATFDGMVQTNLRGCFLGCQAALRHWRAHAKSGQIVNISSRTGLWPHPEQGGYAATKAGIVALTFAIAEEVEGSGTVANVVCPRGWSQRRIRPASLPADVVDEWDAVNAAVPVLYLCSPEAGWCNGQVFAIEGFQLAWLHGWTTASGIRKGSSWDPKEMHEAFRRLTGVVTQMSDESGKRTRLGTRYESVVGVAGRGRLLWD